MSDQASSPRLLDQVRGRIRRLGLSKRTEVAYIQWIRRYIRFSNMRHPAELGKKDMEAFLTHLAVNGKVTSATQNQALSALLFLYRQVLNLEMPWLADVQRAKPSEHVPVVLTRDEVSSILEQLSWRLMVGGWSSLWYGHASA